MNEMSNVDLFIETLPLMAKGMAGIFCVTLVIIAAMYLLQKLSKKK